MANEPLANQLLQQAQALILNLSETPLLSVSLTLAAYFLGIRVCRFLGNPAWCPPVAIAALFVALALAAIGVDYGQYRDGAEWITWLLGPATVALGVPLYQQAHHIRAFARPILFTLPAAAVLAAGYAVGLAVLFNASPDTVASVAPKSVTTPIAIGITEQIGGAVSLMMGGLLVTGVCTIFFVDTLAPRLKVKDERILGLVLGINGHAIGTVRAFEIGATAGAFASLGMSLTGVFTALWLPLVWPFFVGHQ